MATQITTDCECGAEASGTVTPEDEGFECDSCGAKFVASVTQLTRPERSRLDDIDATYKSTIIR